MKKIMPKIIFLIVILFVIVGGILLFLNKNNDSSNISSNDSSNISQNNDEEILKNSEIYKYSTLEKQLNANMAKAQELNGKYFIFYGTISSISTEYVTLENDYSGTIKAYLDIEILKTLNKNEQIAVTGKIENVSNSIEILKDAMIVSKDDLEKYFIIDVTSEKSSYTNYKYSNYEYDNNGRKISYNVSGDSTGKYTLVYDENNNNVIESTLDYTLYGKDVSTFTYDDNGNILTETVVEYNKDGTEENRNVFSHTIELNENGKIAKDTYYNTSASDFKYEKDYTYEDDRIIEEKSYEFHSNGEYTYKYSYDSFGNLINKSMTGTTNGKYASNTFTYTYAIMAKK